MDGKNQINQLSFSQRQLLFYRKKYTHACHQFPIFHMKQFVAPHLNTSLNWTMLMLFCALFVQWSLILGKLGDLYGHCV